jgi:hypothetical protein
MIDSGIIFLIVLLQAWGHTIGAFPLLIPSKGSVLLVAMTC